MIGAALIAGAATGLSAVVFSWLTNLVGASVIAVAGVVGLRAGVLGCMLISGFVVGLIVRYWAPEVRGSGVPDVMEAVAIRGGRIRPRVAYTKIVATSLTVGSGGSAGREGPIVQIGSAIGSSVGQWLHFSDERVRTLAACGAAGGVAAAFNAPIAGALFATEIILGSLTVRYFGAVVISAVTASIVSEVFLGDMPVFHVPLPAYPLHHASETLIYAALGLLAAGVSVLFIRARFAIEDVMEKWRAPLPIRTTAGMAIAAMLGLMHPDLGVLGSGLPSLGRAIAGNIDHSVSLMAALLVLKIIATSFTVGSGNAGGIFAPSLYIGAMLGGMVGAVANQVWPGIAPNPGAYAIVGMAAVFSGVARAPITSILIVFEMTGDYHLILPLMLATVLSTLVAERLLSVSMYTWRLRQRGINLERGRDIDVLQSVTVGEVLSPDFDSVAADATLGELSDRFAQTHRHGFPILDERGKLCGIVTISDLDRAIAAHLPDNTTALEIGMRRADLLVAAPNESVGVALARMGMRGLGRLPVVAEDDPDRLLGMIRRADIIRAYDIALSRRADVQNRTKRMALRNIDGTVFSEITLQPGDPAVGKRLAELSSAFPQECILVSVRRQGRMLIPHGDTVFQAGDLVTLFVNAGDLEAIWGCLHGSDPPA